MHRRIMIAGVFVAVAGVVAWQYRVYAGQRDHLNERIKAYSHDIQVRDQAMEERAKLMRELKAMGATTFGSEEEKVTASFRKALNEMVAHFGLIEASVTSSRSVGVKNPAVEARVREFSKMMNKEQRAAASLPDFLAVSGTLSAKGTLEQALRVLATLQVQPWIHRIDGFSLRPVGREGSRVEMSVMLTTTYFSDPRLREGTDEVGWRPVREAEFAAWMPIVLKNMFREPAPAAAVAANDAPPPPETSGATAEPPPPPPYDEWRISGVARGAKGPILMVVNERTHEWRTIDAGGTILDATFVSSQGEVAEITIGQERFAVRTGQRLSERSRIQ
ncbi:MAG: hypothetical protein AB7G11_15805 [Phycisphaerales bacterium]